MTLILASKSSSRRKILEKAGLNFKSISSHVDEGRIKKDMLEKGHKVSDIAKKLAMVKALEISKDYPEDYIIGGDQILSCGGQLYSKARDIDEAREHLNDFKGRKHRLTTSVVLAKNDKIIWTYISEPELTMRVFSNEFLEAYLRNAADALYSSVGCYFIEDIGIQLFSEVNGEYSDILGLPLLPLLIKLRELKIIND